MLVRVLAVVMLMSGATGGAAAIDFTIEQDVFGRVEHDERAKALGCLSRDLANGYDQCGRNQG